MGEIEGQTQDLASLEKELAAATPQVKSKSAAKVPAGKKKKQSAPRSSVLWTIRVERRLSVLWNQIVEIARGMRSNDAPTRRMSALFLLSLACVLSVMGMAVVRYWTLMREGSDVDSEVRKEAQHIGEFMQRQADEAKHKSTLLTLGTFTVELKPIPDQKVIPGVLNLAEVELVLECDSKETCVYIEENLSQAKNQVTGIFTAIDRDELMSREGKRKIKKAILEKLNGWLPQGRVESLYFSKLVLS